MAAHIDPFPALLGAVRTTITDALNAGVPAQTLRDILGKAEHAAAARLVIDHAADAARLVALSHPAHHDRTGTAGRTPVTLTVTVDASQARCDDCGSLVEVWTGTPRYRHTFECEHKGRIHYRNATDAHLHCAQAAAHARHVVETYDRIEREWDIDIVRAAHADALFALESIEAAVMHADNAAETAPPLEDDAARAAAMIAHGFRGQARGFLRLIEIRLKAMESVA